MNIFLDIVAWVSIVLSGLSVLAVPLLLGKPRPAYTYANFISSLLEFIAVGFLAARVLGYI